ncbi:hypothetical protein ABT033_31430 [Streptomyces pharetrae]|uniref:hypothetical protein n=1 Tax=Streptomyces pharetrae TaxID=291370 RepID=UPI00335D92F6
MSSRARAASLIATAMDVAYAGDDEMTIAVHNTNGSVFTIVGRTSSESRCAEDVPERDPLDFEPKDVAALVDYLASLLVTSMPKGAISVRVPNPENGGHLVWVWSLATLAPLRVAEAEQTFPGVDVPSSHSAYGHISDRERITPSVPLTPLTDRTHVSLIHHAHN